MIFSCGLALRLVGPDRARLLLAVALSTSTSSCTPPPKGTRNKSSPSKLSLYDVAYCLDKREHESGVVKWQLDTSLLAAVSFAVLFTPEAFAPLPSIARYPRQPTPQAKQQQHIQDPASGVGNSNTQTLPSPLFVCSKRPLPSSPSSSSRPSAPPPIARPFLYHRTTDDFDSGQSSVKLQRRSHLPSHSAEMSHLFGRAPNGLHHHKARRSPLPFNHGSSALNEKLSLDGEGSDSHTLLFVPLPFSNPRRKVRLSIPIPSRVGRRLLRPRSLLVLLGGLVLLIWLLGKSRKKQGDGTKKVVWQNPFTPSTSVFSKEEIKSVWEWEVMSGHHPSARKCTSIPSLACCDSLVLDGSLATYRETSFLLLFSPGCLLLASQSPRCLCPTVTSTQLFHTLLHHLASSALRHQQRRPT